MDFQWPIGDDIKKVSINYNQPGSGGYTILLNGFNQGEAFRRDGSWTVYKSTSCILSDEDIKIFTGIIDKNPALFKPG